MKTVLIPTDFTVSSLSMVKQAATYFGGEKVKVVLFHALYTPTDIQDLLFLSNRIPHEKITEDFRHSCMAIKKKHSDVITNISFKHIYGNSGPVFRNFIEATDVDCIFFPAHIQLQQPYPNSVDVRSLFSNATVPYISDATIAIKKVTSPLFTKSMMLSEA